MAENKDDIDVPNEGGGKGKLLIIALIALLLIMAGLVAFLLLGSSDDESSAEETPKEQVKKAAIYFTVDKPFIINFSEQSNDAVRYMQVKMKVMSREQAAIDAFQLHMPAIQHEVNMLLYSQNYDTLVTTEGKESLKQSLLDKINEVLKTEEDMENAMERVYFASFIMQ